MVSRAEAPRGDPSIDEALRSLAPPTVRVGSRLIDQHDLSSLRASEQLAVAGAVSKRRHEFATGRALLRELLEWDGPIGVEPTRAPRLPDGWRGSLAHDHHIAVAAVTPDPGVAAVGIDVEPMTELTGSMADIILRPDERGLDAHLAFTLKEAAYKAWSSLGGAVLDHQGMRLTVGDGRFTATVVQAGATFDGRFAIAGERRVALVVTRAVGSRRRRS